MSIIPKFQLSWDQLNFLRRKKDAYHRLFMANGKLKPEAEIILKDLYKFCRARTPISTLENGSIDPYRIVAAAARREVYDRITHYIFGKDKDVQNVDLGE